MATRGDVIYFLLAILLSISVPSKSDNSTTVFRCQGSQPTPPRNIVCREGYKPYENVACYKLVHGDDNNNWIGAKQFCEKEGSYLAVPNSHPEIGFLLGIQDQRLSPWIGVSKLGDTWVSVTGHPLNINGFAPHWAEGKPSGSGNCVGLTPCGLADYKCDDRGSFICEHGF